MKKDTTDQMSGWGTSSRIIHTSGGGGGPGEWDAASGVSFPIFQTTSFGFSSPEQASEVAGATHPSNCYTRYGNPNTEVVERVMRDLEGGEAALATGSGMGAISLVLLGLLRSGDHVVAQRMHYAATMSLLRDRLPGLGIEVTLVDQTDPAAFEAAITEKTRMIYVETPVNPTLALTDLEAVAHLARSHGVLTCVDSTFASPLGQRPIEHGIDLVVHSATKFLGGHSDVTAGVIVGTRDLINRLWDALIIYGMILHPFEAWLLARGIQTLTFRMERHNNNSQEVARYLEGHPGVLQVHYPGLASHPQHALARRQMTGFGGVVSFEPKGGYEAARRFVSRLRLAKLAVSLGGTKTLAVHTASMIFAHHTREERKEIGVSEGLVRLAVGIEDVEDIITDFDQALRARTAA